MAAASSTPPPLSPIPPQGLLELRDELTQTQLALRREQSDCKQLRSQKATLERQLAELQQWQGNNNAFENDVAAAIQLAQRADDSRTDEIARLQDEIEELRKLYEGESDESGIKGENPAQERKRLQEQAARGELQLRAATLELDRAKKDLFAERVRAVAMPLERAGVPPASSCIKPVCSLPFRATTPPHTPHRFFLPWQVKSKRGARDLEAMRVQLRSAREEMGRLYDDLARARHEISRLTVLVTGMAALPNAPPAPSVSMATAHAQSQQHNPFDRLQEFLCATAATTHPPGSGGKDPSAQQPLAPHAAKGTGSTAHLFTGSTVHSAPEHATRDRVAAAAGGGLSGNQLLAPAASSPTGSLSRNGSLQHQRRTGSTLPVNASGAIAAATRQGRVHDAGEKGGDGIMGEHAGTRPRLARTTADAPHATTGHVHRMISLQAPPG